MTTKIVALVDALGNLVRFVLLPGQRYDSAGVAPLLTELDFSALLADKVSNLMTLGYGRPPVFSKPFQMDLRTVILIYHSGLLHYL